MPATSSMARPKAALPGPAPSSMARPSPASSVPAPRSTARLLHPSSGPALEQPKPSSSTCRAQAAAASFFESYDSSALAEVQRALNSISPYLPKELKRTLPGLLMCGDQSVGKTSVMSALAGTPLTACQLASSRQA